MPCRQRLLVSLGVHGTRAVRRRSAYRERLEEKQKVRFHYGVSERQLRQYFAEAARRPGRTGEAVLQLLERRLDNVIFRLGVAPTIVGARQLVVHGHVLVEGHRVNRPGYRVRPGQSVALSARARRIPGVIEQAERGPELRLPGYLARRPEAIFEGRVVGEPQREDVPITVNEAAVTELDAR